MATAPQFVGAVNNQVVRFTNADGTTAKAIFVCSNASGSVIRAVSISTSAIANVTAAFALRKSAISYPLGQAIIPNGAGTTSTRSSINIIDPAYLPFVDFEPNRGVLLMNGEELYMNMTGALPVAENVDVVVFGGDY